jgi:hypothetical protein
MRLRKFLIAGSALAAAAALTLIPAAQASSPTGGPIASVSVGGSTTTANYPATLTLKSGTSFNVNVFGSSTKLTCSSGGMTGTVHAGSPAPTTFMNFSSLMLNCDAFIPGQTVVWSVPANGCARLDMAFGNTHDGTVDTGPKGGKFAVVDGTFTLPAGCVVTVTAGSACTITIGGSTPAQFDEADKDPGAGVTQDLILKGIGLTILTQSFGCFGMYTVGGKLTLNSVKFNVVMNSGAGAVDFRKSL